MRSQNLTSVLHQNHTKTIDLLVYFWYKKMKFWSKKGLCYIVLLIEKNSDFQADSILVKKAWIFVPNYNSISTLFLKKSVHILVVIFIPKYKMNLSKKNFVTINRLKKSTPDFALLYRPLCLCFFAPNSHYNIPKNFQIFVRL